MLVPLEFAAGIGQRLASRVFGDLIQTAQDSAPQSEHALSLDELVEGEWRRLLPARESARRSPRRIRGGGGGGRCQKEPGGWAHRERKGPCKRAGSWVLERDVAGEKSVVRRKRQGRIVLCRSRSYGPAESWRSANGIAGSRPYHRQSIEVHLTRLRLISIRSTTIAMVSLCMTMS